MGDTSEDTTLKSKSGPPQTPPYFSTVLHSQFEKMDGRSVDKVLIRPHPEFGHLSVSNRKQRFLLRRSPFCHYYIFLITDLRSFVLVRTEYGDGDFVR